MMKIYRKEKITALHDIFILSLALVIIVLTISVPDAIIQAFLISYVIGFLILFLPIILLISWLFCSRKIIKNPTKR